MLFLKYRFINLWVSIKSCWLISQYCVYQNNNIQNVYHSIVIHICRCQFIIGGDVCLNDNSNDNHNIQYIYGTVIIHISLRGDEILKRPEYERPFLLLVVGRPVKDAKAPDIKRKDISEIMTEFK